MGSTSRMSAPSTKRKHMLWSIMVLGSIANCMARSGLWAGPSPVASHTKSPFKGKGDMFRLFEGSLKVDISDEFGIRLQ